MKKLLLISNSTNYGETYLLWPRPYIKEFLGETEVEVLFIPYAGVGGSWDDYETKVNNVFNELGHSIKSIHQYNDPIKAVAEAKAIAVGGGNTFHLVYMLHKLGLIEPIQKKVNEGMPYMGWSAGANVACPSMKTTNDMPIIEPASFNCFNLVPFQINPHFLDANPDGHGGETRQQRIEEFMEINKDIYIAGLREGTLFQIEDDKVVLKGKKPLCLFINGKMKDMLPSENFDFLLKNIDIL